MTDIELVIKIPQKVYKDIQNKSTKVQAEGYSIENAVLNGTPLPAGHGRLGDVDKLNNIFNEACKDFNIDNIAFMAEMDECFYLAPTIIEADNGSEE